MTVIGFALGGTVGIGTLAFAFGIGPAVELSFWLLERSPLADPASNAVARGVIAVSIAPMKGLVCAGGEATRLGELTRVTNKHLLPVGSWPMVYYPLQLLQLAGIREVLVVTGKGHAGQMIDLLGDGHLTVRGGDAPLLELDLTYKVQTQPGGIAEVVGMAEDFAAGDPLVVVLGDNIFEYSHAAEIAAWGASGNGAQVFVKEVPDPENFGVVVYDEAGGVIDLAEKAGVVDLRYPRPRRTTPLSASTATRRTSSA